MSRCSPSHRGSANARIRRPYAETVRRWPTVLALVAAACLAAAPATAEQASQPSAAAAGRLDAGRLHTCAVVPAAEVRCWGIGVAGALGYANTVTIGDDEPPAAAGSVDVGPGRSVRAISAGLAHTCALLDAGAVRCWGFAANGRLGYANVLTIGDDEPPAAAGPVDLGAGRNATAISAGGAHSCAVLDDGTVRCWGFNTDGRLGYGRTESIGDTETPGSVDPVRLGPGRTASAITAGDSHTCALLDDGNVRCWGYGASGQLGYASVGNVGDDEAPELIGPVVLGTGRSATAIAAGDFHTCAVLDDGSVRCWGHGANGQLGYGNTDNVGDTEVPASAGPVSLGAGRTATAIAAGANHTCALLDDRTVRCWGHGGNGQLGYGGITSIGDDEAPAAAGPVDLGANRTAVAITAGGDHTCARLDDDSVRCWGRGLDGELGNCSRAAIGDDETPASTPPVDLGVPGAAGECVIAPQPPAPTPPQAVAVAAGPPPAPVVVDALAQAIRRQSERAAALRACRASVTRRMRGERNRARRIAGRTVRARALRSVIRRAAQRRRICLRRHGRTPARVTTLSARASARGTIVLSFNAVGTDGSRPPAARSYVVRQSLRPIRTARDFARASSLCRGTCRFPVTRPGNRVTLTVTNLRRRTAYYYAVAARDNVSGRLGNRSKTVETRTR